MTPIAKPHTRDDVCVASGLVEVYPVVRHAEMLYEAGFGVSRRR
ncbi:MAG TPA: hypothetical protein VF115_01255 [Acidimicrobiia bacterium]